MAEGRSITFDAKMYLAKYADLRAAFGNDIVAATKHYITNGFAEGRTLDLSGNGTLMGSASNDVLDGGAGNDTVCGGAGDDTLDGENDDSWIMTREDLYGPILVPMPNPVDSYGIGNTLGSLKDHFDIDTGVLTEDFWENLGELDPDLTVPRLSADSDRNINGCLNAETDIDEIYFANSQFYQMANIETKLLTNDNHQTLECWIFNI
jgi:Ca2+-binding RTX toxin-like protein